jgi:hypothetical protein
MNKKIYMDMSTPSFLEKLEDNKTWEIRFNVFICLWSYFDFLK